MEHLVMQMTVVHSSNILKFSLFILERQVVYVLMGLEYYLFLEMYDVHIQLYNNHPLSITFFKFLHLLELNLK